MSDYTEETEKGLEDIGFKLQKQRAPMSRTPTPWQYNQSEYEANSSMCEIRGPNGAYSITRDTSAANAAFIVLAVNSFDALTEALRQTTHELAVLVGKDHSTVVEATAALKLAEGVQL